MALAKSLTLGDSSFLTGKVKGLTLTNVSVLRPPEASARSPGFR